MSSEQSKNNSIALSPEIVEATLADRMVRDCIDSLKHTSIAAVIGIIEIVKHNILAENYAQASKETSEVFRNDQTIN